MCVCVCYSRGGSSSQCDSDEGGGVRPGGNMVDDFDHLRTRVVFTHCCSHHLETTTEQQQGCLHGETLTFNLHHTSLTFSIVAKSQIVLAAGSSGAGASHSQCFC